ncbi:transposase [Streptomyces sp. H27-C3]|uniref:IS701 family transposase n=1 Tax=Streptomyces sp. H27-C3 TaxID=3046305 RepID=UPI0032D956CA
MEAYAARFDDLFSTLAQRRGFREYLTGLLLPRDRNKTLTALAGTVPVVGAQHAAVQRLQFFLSESTWDHEQVNARRVALLLTDPATAPHPGGVLVIDDSGDRKDGQATAHIGRQWLGRLGKTDNGIVTVITCWADEDLYYPLHAVPYTRRTTSRPARRTPGSARSCGSPPNWPAPPRRSGLCSGRWPQTAATATRAAFCGTSARPACHSWWP